MKIRMIILFIFSYALFVQATIVSVPATKSTLLEAIKIAADGDTILVEDGTFAEHVYRIYDDKCRYG